MKIATGANGDSSRPEDINERIRCRQRSTLPRPSSHSAVQPQVTQRLGHLPMAILPSPDSVAREAVWEAQVLTYLNGLSLVIGLIIGSGIFSSPAQVNTNAGSPGASLLSGW